MCAVCLCFLDALFLTCFGCDTYKIGNWYYVFFFVHIHSFMNMRYFFCVVVVLLFFSFYFKSFALCLTDLFAINALAHQCRFQFIVHYLHPPISCNRSLWFCLCALIPDSLVCYFFNMDIYVKQFHSLFAIYDTDYFILFYFSRLHIILLSVQALLYWCWFCVCCHCTMFWTCVCTCIKFAWCFLTFILIVAAAAIATSFFMLL